MTSKADFTDEEWTLLREAPTSAGMLVVQADKGGMFRETFSMAKAYTEALRAHGLDSPAAPGADRPVYVRLPYLARRRAALLAAARENGLELGLWFEAPVHPSRTNLAAVGYTGGNSPVAERTSYAIVNLPCHPRVTLADVARYVELLARVEG